MLLHAPLSLFRGFGPPCYHPRPLALLFRTARLRRYFGACKQKGVVPAVDCAADGADGLEHLRTILSTGSPLLPEHFQWIYEVMKKTMRIHTSKKVPAKIFRGGGGDAGRYAIGAGLRGFLARRVFFWRPRRVFWGTVCFS